MKAIRVTQWGEPIQLEDIPQPTPGRDEVLLRVHAASINPVDAIDTNGGVNHVGKPSYDLAQGRREQAHQSPLLPDYQVKAGVDDTEGRFSFLEVTMIHDIPRHIHHTDDEAFYLLEGELEVEFEGQKYSVTPGTFILLPHGIPHQVTRISQTPPRLLQISSPGGFEHFVEDLVEAQAIGDLPPEKLAAIGAEYNWTFLP